MRRRHTPEDTFRTFEHRIKGSGVQKLDRTYPSGAAWIFIDRENKKAFLAVSRSHARNIKKGVMA